MRPTFDEIVVAEHVPGRQQSRMVYFIQCGAAGPIKVGIAVDPRQRLREMQTGNHEVLRLIGFILTDNARELERDLHAALNSYHLRGEWFHCDPELLATIRDMTKGCWSELAEIELGEMRQALEAVRRKRP